MFERICGDLIKNVLISSKDFSYITEIDLIGTYKSKKIYFMCKNRNEHQIINDRRAIKKNIELVQKYLKPDIIFLVVSCDYPYDKKHFEEEGIFFIDAIDFDKIKKDKGTSVKNENNLKKLMKINDIKKLHFMANIKLALRNEEALVLKYVRRFLSISLKELSKKISSDKEYIQNLETGRKTSSFLEKKIEDYFKTFKDFNILKQKAIKLIPSQKEIWEKAKSFDKIINFKGKPVNGDKLENEAVWDCQKITCA